jgi:diguanylate cyclase (GGDEF)-like protein
VKTRDHYILLDIAMAAVFAAYVLLIYLQIRPQNTYRPFTEMQLTDFSSGWTGQDGSPVSLRELGTAAFSEGAGGKAVILKKLPAAGAVPEGTDLCFRSKNVDFTVWIEDRQIYSFTPVTPVVASRSYGSCIHHISIAASDADRYLRIEAEPIYHDNNCFFDLMYLGDSGAYYQTFMAGHFTAYILCIIIAVFGLLMLLLSLLVRKTPLSAMNFRSLGCFAVMLGTWAGLETLVPQMLTGHTVLYHGLNYLLLILLPYPAVQFTNSLLLTPKKIYARIAFFATLADFLLCVLLNFLRIRDYHEMLPVIHGMLILTALMIIVMFVINARECREKQVPDPNRIVFLAYGILLLFGVADVLRYRFSGSGVEDAGYFMRIGILLFVLILFIRSMVYLMRRLQLASETETISRIAYADALTGAGNRAAFLKKEQELQQEMQSGAVDEVMICQFDVNNLKLVNDRYGHAVGDSYIRSTAGIITDSFGKDGFCYRIGGDEFTAFLVSRADTPDSHAETKAGSPVKQAAGEEGGAVPDPETACSEKMDRKFRECYSQMRALEDSFNSKAPLGIRMYIACGHAVCTKASTHSLEDAEKEADRRMYADKRNSKKDAVPATV